MHAIKDKRARVYHGMRFELNGVKDPLSASSKIQSLVFNRSMNFCSCLTSRQFVSGPVRP